MSLRLGVAVGSVMVLLGLTGCSRDSTAVPETSTSPSDIATSTEPPENGTASSAPSPSSSSSAWESKFTEDEIAAFQAALKRYETYLVVSEPIWAKGRYTPEAEALIKRFWAGWQTEVDLLRGNDAGNIQIKGSEKVLWAKPTRIKLDEDGAGSITILACVDYTGRRFYQDGERITGGTTKPQNVTITTGGYADSGPAVRWLVTTKSNPEGKDPCDPDA